MKALPERFLQRQKSLARELVFSVNEKNGEVIVRVRAGDFVVACRCGGVCRRRGASFRLLRRACRDERERGEDRQ